MSVATIITALGIAFGTPPVTPERQVWAKETLEDPSDAANHMLTALLATKESLSVAAILGLTDAEILTAVNDSVVAFE